MTITTSRAASPWTVLAICCCSLLLVSIDVTIVNIALPTIRRDLHSSLSGLQWVIDAYSLVLAAMLMFSGSLGDRLGRRSVFLVGLVVFTAASLACGFAPSLSWLVAFRIVQAVGGSMLNPVAMSIIVNAFRDPADRARAIGVWAAVVGLSMALGPLVGGALVDGAGWRWIFWVNVPVGIVAIALTLRWIPESRAPRPRRFDPLGQLLVAAALGSLTYAIIDSPRAGWTATSTLTLLVIAATATAGLLAVEPRRRDPLLELRFFRSVPFSSAIVCAVAAFVAMGTFLFANTLYLQDEMGLSAFAAGRRRPRDRRRRHAARADRRRDVHPAPAHRVRPHRPRIRAGERPDYHCRDVRHAARAGGSRSSDRLDQPTDRHVVGRGGKRLDHRRHDRWPTVGIAGGVVAGRRVRRGHHRPRRPGHDAAGPGERRLGADGGRTRGAT
jgi:MFS family permease